ncbi:class I SAM-dependent methyltransferase [Luteococcus sp. OSA5]|uniref:class I SAM-dependent methyltransferase n=1 Tax=Luteococcus sp. OSA5 TaxID=3401630 RepID=UPI003B437EA9
MTAADEELTASTYDTVADAYADDIVGLDAEQSIDVAMIDLFTCLVPAPRHVLDAGCGAGRMLPHLASKDCDVEGIDLSMGMIARARRDHPAFRLQIGSLTRLPYADGNFDGVFSWSSTMHNPDEDLDIMITEMVRVLRPAGLLLAGFQTGHGMRRVGKGYEALGYDVVLNRWHRTPDTMAGLLEQHGMMIVARMEREAMGTEGDGQSVLIARRAS